MHIEIADDIGESLGARPNTAEIDAIESLARARRRGRHFLLASRRTLTKLTHCPQLSEAARGVFKNLLSKVSTTSDIRTSLSIRIRLTHHCKGIEFRNEKDAKIITITPDQFAQRSMDEASILLCENILDAKFYSLVAEWSKSVMGLDNISVRFNISGGGGSTTAEQFEQYCKDHLRLCLCIVDSDRRHPKGTVGDTARSAMKKMSAGYPFGEVVCTPGRAVENLIPVGVLRGISKELPSAILWLNCCSALTKAELEEALDFADMKAGVKGKILFKSPGDPESNFWQRVHIALRGLHQEISEDCATQSRCADPASCSCRVTPGIANSLLEWAHEFLDRNRHDAPVGQNDSRLHKQWSGLGRILVSWGCGTSIISV